jgi:paired amphipathic helix protein Sin3a
LYQREWNKVWREVEIKNYYKALDYQGVIFKSNDRKSMSVKYMVSEIKGLHLNQAKKPYHLGNLEPQFSFQFKNKKVFKDVTRVLYSYFERQTTYGTQDCDIMKAFIEMFLPIFFDIPDVLPEVAVEQQPAAEIVLEEDEDMLDDDEVMDDDVDDDDEDDDTQNSYDSSTDTSRSTRRGGGSSSYSRRNGRRSPRHKPSDDDHQRLLKDVLTKTMKSSVAGSKTVEVKKEVIQVALEEEEEEDPSKEQKIYNLFGNTTFYCFFRLFQV